MSETTYAALDLGSNSFHMLVVRIDNNHMSVLDTLKEPVRLGAGLTKKDALTADAQERALECLQRFAQRLRGLNPEHIRIVGTNTLRRAKNAREFLKKAEAILPVAVNVLGGSEEARLIYHGVTHYLAPSSNRNFVIDIGGGSTELIIGRNLNPMLRESLPMGCVSFSLEYFPEGRLSKKAFANALLNVGQLIEPYTQSFSSGEWEDVIGASGTIKAIASIHQGLGFSADRITLEGMHAIRDGLLSAKRIQDSRLPGLREDRQQVFAGGFAVLFGLFQALGIKEMRVSANALREGVLLDLWGRERNQDKRQETVDRLKHFYSVDLRQAKRVRQTALQLFPQVLGQILHHKTIAKETLGWAADLHEIGLAIAHHGYHKHGAYIIQNGDLDGFSQSEQGILSFLVLNHRKRLKTIPLRYEHELDWPLVFVLRLAHILHRERRDLELPKVEIGWKGNNIDLLLEPGWLEAHPLTRYDLNLEKSYWRRLGFKLHLSGQNLA